MTETPERLERMDRPPNTDRLVEVVFEEDHRFFAVWESGASSWFVACERRGSYRSLDVANALGWRELQPYALPLELPDGWHEYMKGTKPEDMGIVGSARVLVRVCVEAELYAYEVRAPSDIYWSATTHWSEIPGKSSTEALDVYLKEVEG